MKAFLQDKNGNDLKELNIPTSAPDIIQSERVYYRKHFMRKLGDCLYRPASIYYDTTCSHPHIDQKGICSYCGNKVRRKK